jgi:PAS domain-containing protein
VLTASIFTGHPWWHFAAIFVVPLLAALMMRVSAAGVSLTTVPSTWWASVRSAPRPVQALALASAAVAGIHVSVCPEHFQEFVLYGVFFLILATAQLTWGALVATHTTRRVLLVGAADNFATAVLWLVSRTSGLPVGREPWKPEAYGWLDIAASVIELVIVVGALRLARTYPESEPLEWHKVPRFFHALLPRGSELPYDIWLQRHRWIRAVFWAHVPGIAIFAAVRGRSLVAVLALMAILAPFVVLIQAVHTHRRVVMIVTSLALLTCSAELVYLSGGAIEMHFHYFVMVGIVTLYQDWWPFLVAIAYVVLQHGLAGVLAPRAVYDHQSAINDPWGWAAVHGVFVLAMSAAGIASWKLNESFLRKVIEGSGRLSHTLSLLSATLDATADGILVVDHDGHISSYNRRFRRAVGHTRGGPREPPGRACPGVRHRATRRSRGLRRQGP